VTHDSHDHLRESADREFLETKWTPRPMETMEQVKEERLRVVKLIAPQWAEKMNISYGLLDDPEHQYKPEDLYKDPQLEALHPGQDNNRAPLTTDLVMFVMDLRENTDFFNGPNLDQHFPEADDPDFYEVLVQNALLYTEE
jgi:hypothetical protein